MTESTITTVDPTSGAVLAVYPTFDDARIEAAIAAAHAAAVSWAATPLPKPGLPQMMGT
jgi:acyl-CoA reductase-like NAD-dependent aldehyde dehydrogenase